MVLLLLLVLLRNAGSAGSAGSGAGLLVDTVFPHKGPLSETLV